MNYKRIIVIVMDSLGIGNAHDADKFHDKGANTFGHIVDRNPNINIPTLRKLGIKDLVPNLSGEMVKHPNSFTMALNERSNGKDTMTGHWEMMGIYTTKPFISFTDTGFPKELIDELEQKTGHKIIGNYASSGTEILKVLGEEQMRENSLICYTSADSVLQLAAHEEVTGVKELYRCCEIAREICMRPEYKVGRVIARPFIGKDKDSFKRTSNRHDYAVSPSEETVMDVLNDNKLTTSCVGKIADIFNGCGVTTTVHTVSNIDGMNKVMDQVKSFDFTGLMFVNLVEFDSEYGHRRNPEGYAHAIEDFDVQLAQLLPLLHDDDLLMITADHGNDPTWTGSDHTREQVPLIIYNKKFTTGEKLPDRNSFGDIGISVLANFNLQAKEYMIGEKIKNIL
jgi:phosphopentomutase